LSKKASAKKRYFSPASPIVGLVIRGQQIRAARALLGMQQTRLADLAGISATGLAAIEMRRADPKSSTLDRIVRVLEAEGVVFLDEDGGFGPGVRLRRPLNGGKK
jgi:transcriptional regulator with XRE-family HTH domain